MKKVFCHIGNPKAFSTSIQSYLNTCHKTGKVFYKGFCPSNNIDQWYSDNEISTILNYNLRYENKLSFLENKDYIRRYFYKCYEECGENIDLWISSENISMRFILEDIDYYEKFFRIQKVLPEETTFIIIFRNIWHSLRSIYKEYLKVGYTKSFEGFCRETFLFRDSNFVSSLIPSSMINFLKNNLINNNKLLSFIVDDEMGTKGLLKFLNSLTEEKTNNFPHLNKSLNNKELLKLNMEQKSILDASGLIETHRLFWNKRNDHKFEKEIWSKLRLQHKIKRKLSFAKNNNYYSFLGTDLYSYLIELDDNYIKSWSED